MKDIREKVSEDIVTLIIHRLYDDIQEYQYENLEESKENDCENHSNSSQKFEIDFFVSCSKDFIETIKEDIAEKIVKIKDLKKKAGENIEIMNKLQKAFIRMK